MGLRSGSAAWGDYDNDGDLDILLTGYDGIGSTLYGNGYFAKIYRNDGYDEFTEVATDTLTGVGASSAAWGDYNNDGYLDILLTGCASSMAPCSARVSKIYRNDGDDTFVEAVTDPLTGVESGSAAWGDYDNDGDLDVLLTGCAAYSDPFTCGDRVAKIYRNDGDDVFIEAITDPLTGVMWGAVAWGDYDNDGDLDLLLSGYDDGNDHITIIYRNDGLNIFTEAVTDTLPGVKWGSVDWGDYDNDNDLDILLTGSDGGNGVTEIYRNDTTIYDIAPAAPGDLGAVVNGAAVELSWSAPPPTCTTPITALTYNLQVGTAPGQGDIVSPHAFTITDSLTNGLRLLPEMGNVQHGLTATLVLTNGVYYWSVQAVDHAFVGSPFATEEQFTVNVTSPSLCVIKTVEGAGGGISNLPLSSIVTYTIELTNSGNGVAHSVVMTDALPSSVSFGGWVITGSAMLPPVDHTIRWGPHDIPANESYVIRFTANITDDDAFAGKAITNTAYFTSPNAGSGSDDAVFTIKSFRVYLPLIVKTDPSIIVTEYPFTDRCVQHPVQLDGRDVAQVTLCVTSVQIRLDGQMKFNLQWTVEFLTNDIDWVCKGSDVGNKNMYATDNLGNRYDHVQLGGAAEQQTCFYRIGGPTSADGWFLFPRAKSGATVFAFHDDDQHVVIENIVLTD